MGTEIFFGKTEIRLDSPVNKPPRRANQQTEPFNPRRGNSRFIALQGGPSGNRTFPTCRSRRTRCAVRAKADITSGDRTSAFAKAASCLCIATKTSGYPLRLSPEGGMLACRGRTMANKTKGQDHSGTPPTSCAKAPRRRLKLARASTEREGCRFQGRRSRGWCNDPYITRSTLSTGDEGTYDQRRI